MEHQIQLYEKIKGSNITNHELQINPESGTAIFEEGTLIHCAKQCSYEKLISIRDLGILAGDFIGIPEENQFFGGESYFCADFYRAKKEIQAPEIFERIEKTDSFVGRDPFSEKFKKARSLAFIINPDIQLQNLLNTNMYDEQNSNHCLQIILNLLQNYTKDSERRKTISAIPYGIPANAITGIVVGEYLLHREEYMQVLQQIFPDCYILNYAGKVFFDPSLSNEENIKRKEECLAKMPEYDEYFLEWGDREIAAFLKNVPKEMLSSIFSENAIGKGTIDVPTEKKSEAQRQVIKDKQELEQGNIKEQQKQNI